MNPFAALAAKSNSNGFGNNSFASSTGNGFGGGNGTTTNSFGNFGGGADGGDGSKTNFFPTFNFSSPPTGGSLFSGLNSSNMDTSASNAFPLSSDNNAFPSIVSSKTSNFASTGSLKIEENELNGDAVLKESDEVC